MNYQELQTKIAVLEKSSLPGHDVIRKAAPVSDERYYHKDGQVRRKAAVLALMYPIDDVVHLAFMERTTSHPDDKHGGQISFPGGKLEPTDHSMLDCALREAKEEFGVLADRVQIVKHLTPVYVFVSDFMVYPFLGITDRRPDFVLQESEVAALIEVPVAHLLDKENFRKTQIKARGHMLNDVPYYDLFGQILWGATAMITTEILELLRLK